MAQIARNPDSINIGGKTPAVRTAEFTALKANIGSGKKIFFSDISNLKQYILEACGHYHVYTDAQQLATYGNNGDRTNYYHVGGAQTYDLVSRFNDTTYPITPPTNNTTFKQGGTITKDDYNALVNWTLLAGNHYHHITDYTS
jgi:hypothetical protein